MSTTPQGFVIILAVGLAILALAALADRHARRRVEGLLPSAPSGGGAPADHQPGYVTASALTARQRLAPVDEPSQVLLRGATTIDLQLASPDLATHADHRCWTTDARVLVCDDEVATWRELLPIWGQLPQRQALCVAAPSFNTAVIDAFAANIRAGTRIVQALVGDATARAQLAGLAEATPVARPDRQAGAVTTTALGHAKVIAADADDTRIAV